MHRRAVLATVAGAGSVAVAGCTGSAGGTGGASESETATESPESEGEFPRVTDRSFARTGDADQPGETATVAFDGDDVVVTGAISGANGCMEAALETADYDAEANELRVRVATTREGGNACTQQIVYREYEATVTFAGGSPASVVVEHESMGEVRTVAEATP